jgi:hypothetical protein
MQLNYPESTQRTLDTYGTSGKMRVKQIIGKIGEILKSGVFGTQKGSSAATLQVVVFNTKLIKGRISRLFSVRIYIGAS